MEQQGDVIFYQTEDGGEIRAEGGVIEMDGGLATAVYLSLFGGPEDGSDWWGNALARSESERLTGYLQSATRGVALVSGNLRRFEDAAQQDLAWLVRGRIASSVDVTARIEQRSRLVLDIEIAAYGEESRFRYVENWAASEGAPEVDRSVVIKTGDFDVVCSVASSYDGGEAFPSITTVGLGAQTGWVELDYWASSIPDRFEVSVGGEIVLDSGYVGEPSNQGDLETELESRGEQPKPVHETVGGVNTDWPPDDANRLAFFKGTGDTSATVRTFAPLEGTAWQFALSCPGAVGLDDPTELDGLALWLDADSLNAQADGSPIAAWADSSGNGHDFTQGNAGSRPTLRKNAFGQNSLIQFDAAAPQYLDGLHSALQFDPSTEDFTVFAVFFQPGENGEGTVVGWRQNSDSAYQLYAQNGEAGFALGGSGTSSASTAATLFRLGAASVAGDSAEVRRNDQGQSIGATSSDGPPSNVPVRIGARGEAAAGFPFTGYIGEVIMYNRALSPEEVRRLEAYFRRRWQYDLDVAQAPGRIPGLWSWYGADQITGLADGDPVATWADATGNADGTASNTPVWRESGLAGRPFVEFDALAGFTLAAAMGSPRWSVFIVMRGPIQNHSNVSVLYANDEIGLYWGDAGERLQIAQNPGSSSRNRRGDWISEADGCLLAVSRDDTDDPVVRLAGSDVALFDGSIRLADTAPRISGAGGDGDFIGELYEIVVYDRVLSAGERYAVERWLRNKYGITQ